MKSDHPDFRLTLFLNRKVVLQSGFDHCSASPMGIESPLMGIESPLMGIESPLMGIATSKDQRHRLATLKIEVTNYSSRHLSQQPRATVISGMVDMAISTP